MSDDWKGEHHIRNVPRDKSRPNSPSSANSSVARQCAGEGCMILLPQDYKVKWCYTCLKKMHGRYPVKLRGGRWLK